jgi:hypothetical protein
MSAAGITPDARSGGKSYTIVKGPVQPIFCAKDFKIARIPVSYTSLVARSTQHLHDVRGLTHIVRAFCAEYLRDICARFTIYKYWRS